MAGDLVKRGEGIGRGWNLKILGCILSDTLRAKGGFDLMIIPRDRYEEGRYRDESNKQRNEIWP
jgi:hypothetical protein